MKCLEVVSSVGREASGATPAIVGLCRSLGIAGHSVRLLTTDAAALPDSPNFRHDCHLQARVFPVLERSPELSGAMRAAARDSDVVHMHGMWRWPNIYPASAAADAAVPLVISPHGCLGADALRVSRWKKAVFWAVLQRQVFARAALLHAASDVEYQAIRAFGISKPVAVIPIGLDVPDLLPRPLDGPLDDRVVLYLGRLHPIKGLDLLLDAWKLLQDRGTKGWKLRIIGPEAAPGYRSLLETRVRVGLIPAVEFADGAYGDDKWAAYRGASVVVLPSRSENFGMTVVEALVMETPVITTDRAPWNDLPRVGCGWQVACEVDALAEALGVALSLGDAERRQMGARGRAWVLQSFAWPLIARQMAEAYQWAKTGGEPLPFIRVD